MSEIASRDLEYLAEIHPPLERALARIDEEGGREDIPVVGVAVGRCVRVLVRAVAARRILEIGTAIGYSAIWMGASLPEDGELVTIDPDAARTARARENWRAAGLRARLTIENAPALEVLPRLRGPFDVAFIDALKEEYQAYLDGALPLLRGGGLVLVDNLLWDGRASGRVPDDGADTRAIREFNRRFLADERLLATILPVGDGLGVAVTQPQRDRPRSPRSSTGTRRTAGRVGALGKR